MSDWLYHQSTGDLFYLDGISTQPVERGYSGYGSCKNKPEFQGVKQLGPIPRGKYRMGAATEIHGGTIKTAIPLTPDLANNMMGRDGFFVHGDGTVKPGEASEGCIICSLETRKKMDLSAPTTLHVERGPWEKRNGDGCAPPRIPTAAELKNPNTKAIWGRCQDAAKSAANDDVRTCKHFVIWYSDDKGRTPSKKPKRIDADWPYDHQDKIMSSWGIFHDALRPAIVPNRL